MLTFGRLPLIALGMAFGLGVGCGFSPDTPAPGSGGAGGRGSGGGGGSASGGAGGGVAGSGGAGGLGGSGVDGGASDGAGVMGGAGGAATGTGGAVTGTGGVMAGSGGAGGALAGTGGAGSGGAGGGDAGSGGAGGGMDVGVEVPAGSFLEQCFAGVRDFEAAGQISNKRSSNGAYEVRLALEQVPGGIGTSGSKPWRTIRVGIITPNRRVCVLEDALKTAYKGSLHNCMDELTVSDAGLVYKINNPDTDTALFNRTVSTLTITGEGGVPAVSLATVNCTGRAGAACRSGGPCN